MISGARGYKPADTCERSHRLSGVAVAGCRGNAKMDDRWGDKEVSSCVYLTRADQLSAKSLFYFLGLYSQPIYLGFVTAKTMFRCCHRMVFIRFMLLRMK